MTDTFRVGGERRAFVLSAHAVASLPELTELLTEAEVTDDLAAVLDVVGAAVLDGIYVACDGPTRACHALELALGRELTLASPCPDENCPVCGELRG